MSTKSGIPKKRNNEKRKEKSRVAARCRRNKEVQIFSELTATLPAKKEEVEQLDKASIMRLAISYLRVRDVVSMLPDSTGPPPLALPAGLDDVSSELSYMRALDGFVLLLSPLGDIVYCSENIAEHLGLSQMEVMGQSIFEMCHPCEHGEVREALRPAPPAPAAAAARRDLLLRLKCTLSGKGRHVHLKSASYKVIQLTGHILTQSDIQESLNNNEGEAAKGVKAVGRKMLSGSLVAIGRPVPHPANVEIPLHSHTFLSKHSLDMKFTYTDDALTNTLGFEPDDLIGHSLYDYHHAADSSALAHQFKSLLSKGQCETSQYRFLAKSGGFAWVQTQATVITDKHHQPVSVVCINHLVSGIECKDEVFATHQLQFADLKPKLGSAGEALNEECVPSLDLPNGAIVGLVPPEEERPIPVTELIFAPRNKEMNKGFLMFSHEDGKMLKGEPEDLTHLAPTAGDACIPLGNSPFDMFDDFILSDNYCSLLNDELGNGSPVDSLGGDPMLLSSSPETQETDSSCEQSSLLTEISLDAFDSGRSDGEKSPLIPLADELPVLEPAVMWGALPENVSLARPQPTETQNSSPAPALQRLLAAPPTGPPPQDLISNIYSDQGLISERMTAWDTGLKRIMKQEEAPCAKRIKRSSSPVQAMPMKSSQSSSVLMNLLEPQLIPQSAPTMKMQPGVKIAPNCQLMINTEKMALQKQIADLKNKANQSAQRNQQMPPLTPHLSMLQCNMLPLNIDCQMLPIKTLSPTASPYKDRLSPYSSSLSPKYVQYNSRCKAQSPNIVMQTRSDPFLTNKLQSPNYQIPSPIDALLDSNVSMGSPDFWCESDMLQENSDLLNALDDVKLG